MWPKAIRPYLIKPESEGVFNFDTLELNEPLEKHKFEPMTAMQESKFGWIPVLKEGAYVISVSGCWVIKAQIQTKILPAATVNEILLEKMDAIEQAEGRRPGRKEREQLKEDIRAELLPKAFHKTQHVTGWIDPKRQLLIVNAASEKAADEFTAHLRETIGSLPVVPIHGYLHQDLTEWFTDPMERPSNIDVLADMKLSLVQDSTVKATYKNLDLNAEEITASINGGMRINEIACEYNEQMQFIIDEKLVLKRIKWQEKLIEQAREDDDPVTDIMLMLDSINQWFDVIGANADLLKKDE